MTILNEKISDLKTSIYNRYISKDNNYLVFNSCSLSLIKLDKDKFYYLKNGNLKKFDENDLVKLFEMNFVNFFSDENKIVINQHFVSKCSNKNFRLTIFTTTNCNARCHYCFQKDIKRMNPNAIIEQDIINLILRNKDKHIHIKWFGGEPLLNVDMIDRISNQLNSLNIDYSSSMISNGYLIMQNINKLSNWKLKRIQITLDGINSKYNTIKNYSVKNDPNPFQTVICGIKKLIEHKIFVSIRLNFDKNNYKDIIECIDYLHKEIGNQPYLSIYCHNIFGPEENYHLSDGTNIYLIIMKKLMEYGYIQNLFQLGIRYRPLPCSAYSPYFFVVNTQGELLKCEHYVSSSACHSIVGNLKNYITNNENLEYWFNRNYPYEKCNNCDFLPICQGGCKFESMENGSCLPFRDCLDNLLLEYYLSKNKKR